MMEALDLKYFNDAIHFYDKSNYYIQPSDKELQSVIIKNIYHSATPNLCNNIIFYVKGMLYSEDVVEVNTNFVNFLNGLYDLEHRQLINHTPDIFTINQVNIEYNSILSYNEEVEKYLDELCCYNPVRKQALLEIIGYCLTTKNNIQKIIILYGPLASNGKSVLLYILERIVGTKNVCHKSMEDLNKQFMADGMENKLLNISTELPKGRIRDITILKKSTTGDSFETAVKFQGNKTIKSYIKHIFATNFFPDVSDNSEGYFRRLHILPLENRFDPSTSSFDKEKFCTQENLNYLGSKAFKAYIDMIDGGVQEFANKKESDDIIYKHRLESNSVIAFLTSDIYRDGIYNIDVERKIMYEYYTSFCTKHSSMKTLTKNVFYSELRLNYGFIEKTINGKDYFFRQTPITEENDKEL